MFRVLANYLQNIISWTTNGARYLATLHPAELESLLEIAFNNQINDPGLNLGHPFHRTDIVSPQGLYSVAPPCPLPPPAWSWQHMIYGYMIENTRICDVFRRVLQEYHHGEKLGHPQNDTQLWLRNTEELFFRDTSPFSIMSVTSSIRPDHAAIRRNAYMRLFGMDLNHGTIENKPYIYVKADASNNEFVRTFEEYIREVWTGMVYVNTTSQHPIDNQKIVTLASNMQNMLMSRRENGNLSREEFAIVSMMSWFHMTVEWENPGILSVITDLKAEASGPEQRLFKIAQRVGVPAHGLSKSYFDIADAISRMLTAIEMGYFDIAHVPQLYTQGFLPEADMRSIITNWSIISGRDMKAGKVSTN